MTSSSSSLQFWERWKMIIFLATAITLVMLSWDFNLAPSIMFYRKQHLAFEKSPIKSSPGFIWPAPANSSCGQITLTLSNKFRISSSHKIEVLQAGIQRYSDLILFSSRQLRFVAPKEFVLEKLHIEVDSPIEDLQLGMDESYLLQVPDPSSPRVALLKAKTVYGALRGLETFSQLCTYNTSTKTVQVQKCPWQISDEPRFAYRGLLIDTSRHYLPVKVIKKVLDSMAFSKLNVLHWHIVDDQSFPLEIPSFPNLWKGAYSSQERYTLHDAKVIVEYARFRGINVMPEIDIPGHARSWGIGYHKLWPASNCTTPLDVSKEFTFQVIEGIISEFSKVFPFNLFHLGGDEVDLGKLVKLLSSRLIIHARMLAIQQLHIRMVSVWSDFGDIYSTSFLSRLFERNLTYEAGYEYFVLRVQELAMKYGYTPVNWQEVFKFFGTRLHKKTIVHNWWGLEVAPEVVHAGLRCIVSEQMSWYLDHEKFPWWKFYMKDPLENITNPNEQKLVIGVEVCLWGERVDASNIEQKIWPRAAAAAERFWSRKNVVNLKSAEKRLQKFRCLLNERGVAAAPLHSLSPNDTGSCLTQ